MPNNKFWLFDERNVCFFCSSIFSLISLLQSPLSLIFLMLIFVENVVKSEICILTSLCVVFEDLLLSMLTPQLFLVAIHHIHSRISSFKTTISNISLF
jgi:hypothetical protein